MSQFYFDEAQRSDRQKYTHAVPIYADDLNYLTLTSTTETDPPKTLTIIAIKQGAPKQIPQIQAIPQISTSEVATGICLKLQSTLVQPVDAKYVTKDAEAMIITIRVVAIQNGPYKSGLSLMTCLNGGRRVTADTMRSLICYYSISKYFLHSCNLYLMLRQKKKSAGLSQLLPSALPGSSSLSSFSRSLLKRLIPLILQI